MMRMVKTWENRNSSTNETVWICLKPQYYFKHITKAPTTTIQEWIVQFVVIKIIITIT